MSKKLTPWFTAESGIKPVRPGVYIASVGRNTFYRYWTGKYWTKGTYDKYGDNWPTAKTPKYGSAKHQAWISWRGLVEDPKA